MDHVYALSATIRNCLEAAENTFTAFVDKKGFDWVDRELLLYKLLSNNVNVNIFGEIRALYNNTTSNV